MGMVVSFVLTFLVRFASTRFGNDHFTHLSRASQIHSDEWPIRDFQETEWGCRTSS